MYESDSGIEELLRRLGPPDGVDSRLQNEATSDEETPPGDRATWPVDGFENDSDASDVPVSSSPYSIGVEWLAEQMREFVDLHPAWEDAVGGLASHLARAEDTND